MPDLTSPPSRIFRFADVEVREREFQLIKSGQLLPVEPKAFRVLLFLLRNPRKLISKEELMNAIWGETAVTEGSLTRCIWLLRQLLGDDTHNPRFIETITTVGYRLICDVKVSPEAPDTPESPDPTQALLADNLVEVPVQPLQVDPPAIQNLDAVSNARISVPEKRRSRIRSRKLLLISLPASIVILSAAFFLLRPRPVLYIKDYVQLTTDSLQRTIAATDGTRLYLNRNRPLSLEELPVSGGEPAQIPVDTVDPVVIDVAPDGSALLLRNFTQTQMFSSLLALPVLGGTPRRLMEEQVHGAAWSPDGRSLVYSTRTGDIFLARSDGTDPRKIAALATMPDWPRDSAMAEGWSPWCFLWSPDSKSIRFKFKRSGKVSFWQMSADGTDLHPIHNNLTTPTEGTGCGGWAQDGRFHVYEAGGQLWTFDETRWPFRKPPEQAVKLTSGPIRWAGATLSRDGKTVFSAGAKPHGELVHWNPQFKQFEPYLTGFSGDELTFSPDGKDVAYMSYPEGELWRQNLDGSGRVKLSTPGLSPVSPKWSPDGSKILFSVWDGGCYLVPVDGGKVQTLVPGQVGAGVSDPTWSPDGRKFVYATLYSDPRSVIRIFDLDSRRIVTLPDSVGLWSPRWSPDGQSIMAKTPNDSPVPAVEIFSFKTQKWSELAKVTAGWPFFSKDGRYIYFIGGPKEVGIYQIRVSDGKIEPFFPLKDLQTTGWGVGWWFGLDNANSPVLLRDRSSFDIYALTLEEK